MATLTIRDLDDALKQSLRIRAAHRNRSMEEEARQILRAALLDNPTSESDLAQRIRARFAALGDVALPVAEREPVRLPPSFDGGADAGSSTPAKPTRTKKAARKVGA